MIFWTIVFLAFHFILLVKGNIFYKSSIEVGELEIKKALDGGDVNEIAKQQLKLIWPVFILIPFMVIELIYLLSAIDNDFYKYPTLFMILINIISFARLKKSKKSDFSTENRINEYREQLYKTKKRSFKAMCTNFIDVAYFGYMVYCLVFLSM